MLPHRHIETTVKTDLSRTYGLSVICLINLAMSRFNTTRNTNFARF